MNKTARVASGSKDGGWGFQFQQNAIHLAPMPGAILLPRSLDGTRGITSAMNKFFRFKPSSHFFHPFSLFFYVEKSFKFIRMAVLQNATRWLAGLPPLSGSSNGQSWTLKAEAGPGKQHLEAFVYH